MTPYELAKEIHKDLSPIAPKLSAALNRALIDIGEGSSLVGFGPGTNENDDVSFQEFETIPLLGRDPADIISIITGSLTNIEQFSSWKVLVDRKPVKSGKNLELLYTLFRAKG